MLKYKDECVGCPTEKGCLGDTCPYMRIPYHICDICGNDSSFEDIYEYEGMELCLSCLLGNLNKVN